MSSSPSSSHSDRDLTPQEIAKKLEELDKKGEIKIDHDLINKLKSAPTTSYDPRLKALGKRLSGIGGEHCEDSSNNIENMLRDINNSWKNP
ncbi:hypothetical protein I302_102378 [Kwoniella bestiolae CBS 10118]|uniref:Uncharacterized protein n=1 Tax=Kwoniella bestiolae CBS 10118 TaxID=1296100 RepID=A0A1B9GF05_9TREE|nr:hypothetical protein I302_01069 [Kwoniella bestiolae CBS 10118]OCF29561.1 hypothetical protein I302_01069 [Kwoniella bestiolae CBS 10118]